MTVFSKSAIENTLINIHKLPNDALVTAKEAALFLNIKEATLAWYRCHGNGPLFIRLGSKLIRYKVGDLRDYAKGQPMGDGMRKVAAAMLAGRLSKEA